MKRINSFIITCLMICMCLILASINTKAIEKGKTIEDKTSAVNIKLNILDEDEKNEMDTVYVKDFGAKGDGITDDTSAINAAFKTGAPNVIFEKGIYKCSDCIMLYHDVNIYGNEAVILVESYNPKGGGVYSFFRYGEKGVDGKSIYMENLTIHVSDTIYQYENRHLNIIDFAGIYKENVHMKNINVYQDECTVMRHIFTGYAKKIILEDCIFYNLSQGEVGGVCWIAARNGVDNQTVIRNCEFKNMASDEIFAVYGNDTKYVMVEDSKFIFDSSELKKNTIFMSFYEGQCLVNFNNCNFKQYGEALDNEYLLKAMARVQDYQDDKETIVNYESCNFDCDLYSCVFAQINFKMQKAMININNCRINSANAPLNGNFHCYKEDNYKSIATLPTPITVKDSVINVKYSLCEQPNGDNAPFYSVFDNCIINIDAARSVLFSEYTVEGAYVPNRYFILNNSEINAEGTNRIERVWKNKRSNIDDYESKILISNSYLNGYILQNNEE